jgi:hypothetical protein
MRHTSLMIAMTLLVVLANALWYYVKWSLYRQGKNVSWFGDHLRDFSLLREAISESNAESLRVRFKRLQVSLYCMLALVGASFFLLIAYLVYEIRTP